MSAPSRSASAVGRDRLPMYEEAQRVLDHLVSCEARGELGPVTAAAATQVWLLLRTAYADQRTGECWPSHATIAGRLGKSTSTIQRALDALRAAKVIDWRPQFRSDTGRTANLYRLLQGPFPDARTGFDDDAACEDPSVTHDRGGRSPMTEGVGHPCEDPSVTHARTPRSPMTDEPNPENQVQRTAHVHHLTTTTTRVEPPSSSSIDRHDLVLIAEAITLAANPPRQRHSAYRRGVMQNLHTERGDEIAARLAAGATAFDIAAGEAGGAVWAEQALENLTGSSAAS